jgi:hypothetical protein
VLVLSLAAFALAPAAAPAIAAQRHHRHGANAHHGSRAAANRAFPARLRRAAGSTRQADRRLVSNAKALRRCEARHHGRPRSCPALRRAVQRAGSRLAQAKSQLSHVAGSSAAGGAPQPAPAAAHGSDAGLSAPTLSVAGSTLRWTRVANFDTYVLLSQVPGQPDQYTVVSGESVTPPPVPGVTVRYSVRTTAVASAWANPVSISYPAQAPPSDPQAAPALTVSGQTLTWQPVAGVTTYVVMRRVPGHAAEYFAVSGNSDAPAPAAGATVHYSVRTAVEGSEWAPEVTISYPPESSGGPPPPAEPPAGGEGFVKGINTNLQGWGVGSIPEIASEMSNLGVNWAREDLPWSEVEPQPGVYNWSSFDQMVAAARANGVTVLPIVGYAPSWTGPTNAAAYGEFMAKAVERYGPGTAANLHWWELWNEPNEPYAWSHQTPSAEAYARDVLAAAESAKRVSSAVKVLAAAEYNDAPQTGGSTPWETSWVDDMFAAVPNLAKWIDGVSVHPYADDPALPLAKPGAWTDAAGAWAFQRIDTIHSQFEAHGAKLPFWITEDGWSTRNVSEASQQKYYSDLIQQVQLRPWVRALFPYCLREFQANPTNDQSEYGLLKFGSWQPKPAFFTLKAGLATLH